jgi:hypothetical protein
LNTFPIVWASGPIIIDAPVADPAGVEAFEDVVVFAGVVVAALLALPAVPLVPAVDD